MVSHNIPAQQSKPAANQSSFPKQLEKRIGQALDAKQSGVLLHISIDNLSMLISSQGGDFAEGVMQKLMTEIQGIVKQDAEIFHVSCDQISMVVFDKDIDTGENIARAIHELIQNYGCMRSITPIHIVSTIGLVHFPKHADAAKDVINRAYVALNDAKQAFQHYAVYGNNRQHAIESRNQLILASYIQNALHHNRLHLAYQPIVERESGEIRWYECLLRIADDKGNLVSAGPFIPIAEKMGFIDLIDSFVLRAVIEELQHNKEIRFGLNLSNATIQNADWLSMAVKMIAESGVADRLVLEITETSEQRDIKKMISFVSTMKELGCKIALDDFGAGFTSLSQLKHLPVDIIKIDGSYVRDIVYNPESRMFVKTLLDFSHNFGLKTIAEFVENAEIADMLTDMGVDYMQGNYFSPAVTHRSWVDSK